LIEITIGRPRALERPGYDFRERYGFGAQGGSWKAEALSKGFPVWRRYP